MLIAVPSPLSLRSVIPFWAAELLAEVPFLIGNAMVYRCGLSRLERWLIWPLQRSALPNAWLRSTSGADAPLALPTRLPLTDVRARTLPCRSLISYFSIGFIADAAKVRRPLYRCLYWW